jgi:hypothetical protein
MAGTLGLGNRRFNLKGRSVNEHSFSSTGRIEQAIPGHSRSCLPLVVLKSTFTPTLFPTYAAQSEDLNRSSFM